jgi:hypothetical protein
MEDSAELLSRMAITPREGRDDEWLRFVTGILKLPMSYLSAAQEILSQGGWRRITGRGQNPIGYVKTATMRAAMRMGLGLDRSGEPVIEAEVRYRRELRREEDEKKERLCIAEEPQGWDDFETQQSIRDIDHPNDRPVGSSAAYDLHVDRFSATLSGIAVHRENGVWRADAVAAGDRAFQTSEQQIPQWLQKRGEHDAVNWEIVAQYVALKPRMVRALARALRLRFEDRITKRAALEQTANLKEAREIENAWKWIDRCWKTRIAPLFQMEQPPTASAAGAPRRVFTSPSEVLRKKGALVPEIIWCGPSLDNYAVKKRREKQRELELKKFVAACRQLRLPEQFTVDEQFTVNRGDDVFRLATVLGNCGYRGAEPRRGDSKS